MSGRKVTRIDCCVDVWGYRVMSLSFQRMYVPVLLTNVAMGPRTVEAVPMIVKLWSSMTVTEGPAETKSLRAVGVNVEVFPLATRIRAMGTMV